MFVFVTLLLSLMPIVVFSRKYNVNLSVKQIECCFSRQD